MCIAFIFIFIYAYVRIYRSKGMTAVHANIGYVAITTTYMAPLKERVTCLSHEKKL